MFCVAIVVVRYPCCYVYMENVKHKVTAAQVARIRKRLNSVFILVSTFSSYPMCGEYVWSSRDYGRTPNIQKFWIASQCHDISLSASFICILIDSNTGHASWYAQCTRFKIKWKFHEFIYCDVITELFLGRIRRYNWFRTVILALNVVGFFFLRKKKFMVSYSGLRPAINLNHSMGMDADMNDKKKEEKYTQTKSYVYCIFHSSVVRRLRQHAIIHLITWTYNLAR